jgi:hypothetical protein
MINGIIKRMNIINKGSCFFQHGNSDFQKNKLAFFFSSGLPQGSQFSNFMGL